MKVDEGYWTGDAYRFEPREGRGAYRTIRLTSPTGKHKVEITESPTGKTIHIHLDGKRIGGQR